MKKADAEGQSAPELAAACNMDADLMARMLRHLTATHILSETAAGQYAPTALSNAFTEPRFSDGLIFNHDVTGPSFRALPAYLKSISYRTPTSITDGPFQYGHKTDLSYWAWLKANPPYLQVFSNYMGGYRAGRPNWVDPSFYPVAERLSASFNEAISPILLVDIGGGQGHDLEELRAKHPDLPGKLVLQDQPDVIAKVPAGRRFEAVAHDFFTPQPVHGAKAYYLHSVLHDWSDEDCVKILKGIVPAMKSRYSKVLLSEITVPSRGASWPVTTMDWLMMTLLAMRERTRAEWEAILLQAGLKVVEVFTYEMSAESLIEAELA